MLKYKLNSEISLLNAWGLILVFATIIPDEIIHAVWFPRKADVFLYYSWKDCMAFVTSTYPMEKNRFIWMSLFPTLIFGWIPFIIWMIMPEKEFWSSFLLNFGTLSILFGAGDLLNIINTIIQVPKNGITQLSGFNSYWYTRD